MFYLVYKITNQINGKIYIGVHKTSNDKDSYMGSGKALIRAQQKYGLENFTKEILHYCSSEEEMYNKEEELVNREFVIREDTYNLKVGGKGGEHCSGYTLCMPETHRQNISTTMKMQFESGLRKGWDCDPELLKAGRSLGGIRSGGHNKHTDETIAHRLRAISHIDLTKFGWVGKVSKVWNVSNAQVRRFIEMHYDGPVYKKKSNPPVTQPVE